MSARLDRTTFSTSRLLDFCNRKELIAQTGHQPDAWPLVVLKELVDNALDACEETEVAPEVTIQVNDAGPVSRAITTSLSMPVSVTSRDSGARCRLVSSKTFFCLALPLRPRNSHTSSRTVRSRPLSSSWAM